MIANDAAAGGFIAHWFRTGHDEMPCRITQLLLGCSFERSKEQALRSRITACCKRGKSGIHWKCLYREAQFVRLQNAWCQNAEGRLLCLCCLETNVCSI